MDIFNRGKTLFKDIFYSDIREFTTFVYLKSVFSAKWYNLVEPKVFQEQLNWEEVSRITTEEKQSGITVSFYIHQMLLENYEEHLVSRGYKKQADEVYLFKEIHGLNNSLSTGFVPVTAQSLPALKQLVKTCFPEYSNNDEYCNICQNVSLTLAAAKGEKQNYNYLYIENGAYVAFGSVLISRDLKLAYLHNMGTHPTYRRKGLFSKLTNFLTNVAAQEGATVIYANTEYKGASYNGFEKLGFRFDCRYHLFSVE